MLIEIAIIFITLLVFAIIKDRKPKNMPPGPMEVPFIGNCALEATYQLERYRRKYGDIFTTRVGICRFVTISDYQMAKDAMASVDTIDRPAFFRDFALDPNEPGGVVSSNGLQWVHDRRFVLRNLRDLGMGKTYLEAAIQEEAQELVNHIKNLNEKPSKYPKGLRTAVLNIIWQLVASKRYDLMSTEVERVFATFEKFRDESMLAFVESFFPIVRYIIPSFVKEKLFGTTIISNFRRETRSIIQAAVEEHQKTIDENSPRDLIDDYLIDMKKHADDPESLHSIRALHQIVADLFTAGSDTVTNMLRWVIFYMHKYPEATKQCQKEIDSVVSSDSLVSIQDKPRLPYVEAYLTEAFRHSSMLHMSVSRCTPRDCTIGGYFIPKNTVVIANSYFIHYDPKFWKEPEAFKPERFLDEKGRFSPKLGRPFYFGSGRRQCLGEALARMEFFLFAAALLQTFDILVPEGCKQDETLIDAMSARLAKDQEYIYKIRTKA